MDEGTRFRVLDRLFERVLREAPERRIATLHALCDDPDLRTEVRRLLDRAEDSDFLVPGGAIDGVFGRRIARGEARGASRPRSRDAAE